MINKKYKCIFIEVPKTGSTSIRGLLGKPFKAHLDVREVKKRLVSQYPYDTKHYAYYNWIYSKLTSERKKNHTGLKIFDSFFKFGFVRNPWSRTVSLYLRNQGIQMKDKMSFEEFANWIQLSSDTCKHPSPKKNQLDWFTDDEGKVIVDYIGRFENLKQDWEYISGKIGLTSSLPHLNRNPMMERKDYRSFYNSNTIEIIHKKFKTDIVYFDYSFDPR